MCAEVGNVDALFRLGQDERALRRSQVHLLAALTGASGLGAETLFFKLLDSTAGASALTAQVVVACFILGMGLGSHTSARVSRPARVELALALLAFSVAFLPELWLAAGAGFIDLASGVVPAAVAASLFGVLVAGPTAFLLGVTFPALVEREGSVSRPYLFQAAGALLGIVLVEAVLFPLGGLRLGFSAIGALHLAAAGLLRAESWRFAAMPLGRLVPRLVAAGVSSGLYQGAWLFLALLVFNPFYFVQPTVVLAMLAGLFLGARLWLRRGWSFPRTLALVGFGVGLSSALTALAVRLPMPPSFGPVVPALLLLVGVGSLPIGAIYPSHFGTRSVARGEAGAALLSLAAGNVLGLAALGLLTRFLPPGWLFPAVGVGCLLLARSELRLGAAGLVLSLTGALSIDDAALMARDRSGARGEVRVEKVIRGPAELTGIYRRELGPSRSTRRLYQTGFSPIALEDGLEVSIALAGVAYAPRHERALVVGAGSGRSAGVVARAFQATEVFDVGVTVEPLLEYLEGENYQLLEQPGVRYRALDGLLAPQVVAPGLDLIVITVDPAYHYRAAKLYAEETLQRLKRLLRPDGVLVFWADATVDAAAAQTLLNTGAAVFREQRIFLATGGPRGRRLLGYFFLVHSDAPLRYGFDREPVARVVELDEHTRRHAEPSEEFRLPAPGRLHQTRDLHRLVSPSTRVLLGGFRLENLQISTPP